MYAVLRTYGLQRCLQERTHGKRSHGHEQQSDGEADIAEPAAGSVSRSDPPLGGEQPQSIGEVPGGAENSQGIERDSPRVLKFQLHFTEGATGRITETRPAKRKWARVPHYVGHDN